MKSFIASFFLIIGSSAGQSGEVILPYSAFGPQAAAHERIGMEWWQWDAHGDSRPRKYPIKVVVFWEQTLEDTAKNHPVEQAKEKDFRYIEYSRALAYLEATIKEFNEAKIDSTQLEKTLKLLRNQKVIP